MEVYPSDLTDEEWAILEPLIAPGKPGGRPRLADMRAILNRIFYVLRAGCAWRMIPRDYPPKSTVYAYFAQLRDEGVWEQVMTTLRERCRVGVGRQATPSAGVIDSQSVRTTIEADLVAMMAPRSSRAARDTCWLIRQACCSPWRCMRPISRTERACNYCASRSKAHFPAWKSAGGSGLYRQGKDV